MFTVTVAFVVATALFFMFASTRALGIVGVFILLCLQPLVFGGLLLVGALAYFLFFRGSCPSMSKVVPPPGGRRGCNWTTY